MGCSDQNEVGARFVEGTPEQRAAVARAFPAQAAEGRMCLGVVFGPVVVNEAPGGRVAASRYVLRKGLGVWRLVYDGEEEAVADERGIALADHLLKHPWEEPMHAVKLEARVDGREWVQETSGARLNPQRGGLLREALNGLQAAMEDPTLPESEREAARAERLKLLRAADQGGKLLDAAGQAAERVRKALKRLIEGLKTAELRCGTPNRVLRAFGEHLHTQVWVPSVGVGGGRWRQGAIGAAGRFTYVAVPGVVWSD